MKKMKSLKKYTSGLILSLFEIFVGILLLVDPVAFTSGIIMAFGAVLMFTGIICIFKYFRADPTEAAIGQLLLKGLAAIIIGAFCVFGNSAIVGLSAVLTFVYGVIILFIGLTKVQKTVDMLRLKKIKWQFTAVSAAITLICAALILVNPFGATEWIWRFIGISLIVEAVVDAVAVLFGDKDKIENEETEVEEK